MQAVTAFFDLIGASGAVYRFRKVEAQMPPTGGNFVYVSDPDGAPRVVCCGVARNLAGALARGVVTENGDRLDDAQLYIRLNVSSGKREGEHADLIAGLPQPFSIADCE